MFPPRIYRHYWLLAVLVLISMSCTILFQLYSYYFDSYGVYYESEIKPKMESPLSRMTGYLVNTTGCKIAYMSPFHPDVAVAIEDVFAKKCVKPLVYVLNGSLVLNERLSNSKEAKCCYNEIHRVTPEISSPILVMHLADWTNRYSKCMPVSRSKEGTRMTSEHVKIQCWSKDGAQNLWTGFAASPYPPEKHSQETKSKLEWWKNQRRIKPPSILIIGIDSVSRLHMARSLAETKRFLEGNDFVEMKGYTKIGDNTFPNMMAALGGMKLNEYPCWKSRADKLDDCPFIWKNFSAHKYVTGFIEDSPSLAIFNYMKTGFVKEPVDYYLRPFSVAYHGNHTRTMSFNGCVGGLSQTDMLFKYIQEFVAGVKHEVPYFFLSWFSVPYHDYFNTLRRVDATFQQNLHKLLTSEGNDTIIIFMSDHGFRYGDFRETFLGYYEDSLPFFFIRLPPSLKRSYPHWQKNLQTNSVRLSSPLDLHATFQQILDLSSNNSQNNNFSHPIKTKSIYSFFEETPLNRTCESSNIPEQYCRCNSSFGKEVSAWKFDSSYGKQLVWSINNILEKKIKSRTCIRLKFNKYLYVRQLMSSLESFEESSDKYLFAISVKPSGGKFEGICSKSSNGSFVLIGHVSRIDSFEGQSDCVDDFNLKPLCYCRKY